MSTQPPVPRAIAFRLPNARAGTAYQHRIEAENGEEQVIILEIGMPAGLAMRADAADGTISGTPMSAGEYTLTLDYHVAGATSTPPRHASVTLQVLPDPRSMWKNLPSDRAGPYWQEDETGASLRGPDLAVLAASKRGRSHAHVGAFRDDAVQIAHLPDCGWYGAVVADGAGSARYSRRGAAIICAEAKARMLASLRTASTQIDAAAAAYAAGRGTLAPTALEALHQELHTTLSRVVGNAAYYAARAIHDEVAERTDLGGVFRDYASTALIAVCKRYAFGTLCAAYWVGDGAVAVYSARDGVTLLGEVDSGEFAGQTRFLDHGAIEHEMLRARTRVALVEHMTALVLMTDGVSDAKFDTEAALRRAADWDLVWQDLDGTVGFTRADADHEKQQRLLAWLDFWSQGNHDDRTIALIYPTDQHD